MAYKLFDDYDVDCSNTLSRCEVQTIFKTLFGEISKTENLDPIRINKLFTVADINNDNKLNRREFIKLVEDFLSPNYLNV